MKARFLKGLMVLIIFSCGVNADEKSPELSLQDLRPLIGFWRGTGEGKWGKSSVERDFKIILDNNFLENHGRSVYARQEKNRKGEIHETHDIFSFDTRRQTLVLRQFDNEGYATTYYADRSIGSPKKVVFVAERMENLPDNWRARLTFHIIDDTEYWESFELDTAKGEYQLYLTNTFYRARDPNTN